MTFLVLNNKSRTERKSYEKEVFFEDNKAINMVRDLERKKIMATEMGSRKISSHLKMKRKMTW